MTNQSEIARIAAGLSDAQRTTLLTSYSIGDLGYLTTFASGRSVPALFRRGLTHLSWTLSGLTELGLAVRALLEQEQSK